MAAAAAAASSPSPPRALLRKVAPALRVLFRLGADAVLYGYMAVFCVSGIGGVVAILGHRLCGEGSVVQGAGVAVLQGAMGVVLRLSLASAPLFVVRMIQRAARRQGGEGQGCDLRH